MWFIILQYLIVLQTWILVEQIRLLIYHYLVDVFIYEFNFDKTELKTYMHTC